MIAIIACLLAVIVTIPGRIQVSHAEEIMESKGSFFSLPLEEWEQKAIRNIICTMAEKNLLQLGLEKKTLKKKGKKINHVHPLRFVDYIFSDPHLKKCMQQIKKSSFKWNGFVRGFSGRMMEEAVKDNLRPYIPEFSEHLAVNQENLKIYIDNKDWEGLLKYLLTNP